MASSESVSPAWRVLHRRWTRPTKELSFWTFLVVGIAILGGLAVWIELYRYVFFPEPLPKKPSLDPLKLALATAGLAIAGPSAMQLLYSRDKLAIVVAIILFTIEMISSMYLMVFGEAEVCGTFLAGFICTTIAVVGWVLANGEDEIFQDLVDDSAPVGGDPDRNLPGGFNPARI